MNTPVSRRKEVIAPSGGGGGFLDGILKMAVGGMLGGAGIAGSAGGGAGGALGGAGSMLSQTQNPNSPMGSIMGGQGASQPATVPMRTRR